MKSPVRVLFHGHVQTCLGVVMRVSIERLDKSPMSFTEVWKTYSMMYPDHYAVQVFPPAPHFFDQANKYHLFVLPPDTKPQGLDLFDPPVGASGAPG